MTIRASDVLQRARTILQDGGSVRWPLTELAEWLGDGMRELANRKPSATATRMVLALVLGTRQLLPDGFSNMIRVNRNLTGTVEPYVGAATVTPIVREILDAQNPNWHDPARTPFRALARHIIMDPLEPLAFFVYPGNTGTGRIEAILSAIPEDLTLADGADPLDMDTYDIDLPFLQVYQSTLVDYILYRAFSKDMQFAGAADRAAAHFAQFNAAVDNRTQQDAKYNVNTTNSQPNS